MPPNPKLAGIFNHLSDKYRDTERKLLIFMDKFIYPNENAYFNDISQDPTKRWKEVPAILKDL